MAVDVRRGRMEKRGAAADGVPAPPASVFTTRRKLFRRASLTSWGKDNLGMTRAAADINYKELMLTVQQQKYQDKEKAAQRRVSYTESCEGEQMLRQRNERRARLLSRSCARRDFLTAWEMEGRAKWKSNQQALCLYERRLLNYELAVRTRTSAQQCMSRARHANDAYGGIQWFEKNLDKLGLDPGGDHGGSGAGAGGDTLLPDKETQATFRSKLLRTVLDQNFVPSSNAEVMAELRFRGNACRRARREREHRRLKTEVDQRHAKAETDAQRAADEHLDSMLAAGQKRRMTAAAHWELRRVREQQAIRDVERFKEMDVAEEAAFERAFHERSKCAREQYAVGKAGREEVAESFKIKLRLHRDKKRQRVHHLCVEIALKIVDLTVVASETRADRGAPLPPSLWMRLKLRFCSPDPFFEASVHPDAANKPLNPVLEANASLQLRNLERCEGQWRPHGLVRAAFENECSPLDLALSVARDLVETTCSTPRESPTAFHGDGNADNGNTTDEWNTSLRLVFLGGTAAVYSELAGWAGLYCCDLETALECAMDLGTEMATVNAASAGGKKKRRSSGTRNISSVNAGVVDGGLTGGTAGTVEHNQTSAARKAFDPEARKEDVVAFKEAAAAYHALRTNPKKATASVSLATLTDILVKHLACRSPSGRRGWMLTGYPRSVLEAKLLENALTGYMDDDVATELGVGVKGSASDARKKKDSSVPAENICPSTPSKSGLDAILHISASRPPKTLPQLRDVCGSENLDGGHDMKGSDPEDDQNDVAERPRSSADRTKMTEISGQDSDEDTEENAHEEADAFAPERQALIGWWSTFEGGQLVCEVPQEDNDERLLETLFLLVILAQERKEKYEAWVGANKKAKETLAEGETGLETTSDVSSPSVAHRFSPLASALKETLEDIRVRRRGRMSHATRIRVESLTGERTVDFAGVKEAITLAEDPNDSSAKNVPDGTKKVLSTREALQNLEEECAASYVVDWMTAAEYSFARGLRTPDNRWSTVCLRLEAEISEFVSRTEEAAAFDSRARGRSRTMINKACGSGTEDACTHAPPAESDPVWNAIDAFELEAGDIVDDRHTTVDAVFHEIDTEAQRRVSTWVQVASAAAASLCSAERGNYVTTIANLRSLHALFGLEEESGAVDLQTARIFTQTAADGLESELSNPAANSRNLFDTCGGLDLREEAKLACEEANTAATVGPVDSILDGKSEANSMGNSGQGAISVRDFTSVDEIAAADHDADGGATVDRRCDTVTSSSRSMTTQDEPLICGDKDSEARPSRTNSARDAFLTAMSKSRYYYICRVWGVVTRLLRAVERCDVLTHSAVARMKLMKRRRVHLEHKSVDVAVAAVKKALADGDTDQIGDFVQNGVPLWVEDDDTFAADPGVALAWGRNALGLSHIASLTATLRHKFGALAPAAGSSHDANIEIPSAPELADLVKIWTVQQVPMARQEGSNGRAGEEIPVAWVKAEGADGYISALCRAVCPAGSGERARWKRLVHCLLLGHIHALPSLDELRTMRDSVQAKLSPVALPVSNESLTAPESKISSDDQNLASEQEPNLGLFIAEDQFAAEVPLWFEGAASIGTESHGAGGSRDGCIVGRGVSQRVKAVYAEAWSDNEGRLDALDLFLTLCCVPAEREETMTGVGKDDPKPEDDGIHFSAGLFRAFTLLADSNVSSKTDATKSSCPGPPVTRPPPINDTSSIAQEQNRTPTSDPVVHEPKGNPHVTLAQLRAILQHEGMSIDDVGMIFESAWEMDQVKKEQKRQKTLTPNDIYEADKTASATREDGNHHDKRSTGDQNATACEGVAPSSETARGENIAPTIDSEAEQGEGTKEAAEATAMAREGTQPERLSTVDAGATNYTTKPLNEPRVVSFLAVSASSAVCSWVRNGAYTLPSFGVTSGSDV